MSRALIGLQPWRSRSQHDLSAKLFSAVTLLFEVNLKTISHEWSPYWDDMSSATFRLLPWRSRSQQDLTAKTCPAHYIVIWSRILHFLYTNDHHIKTTCCTLHLGRCLEGQGHSMTFQQNRVRLIPLLFEVIWSRISKIFHRNDHHIEMTCRAQHFGLLPWRPRSQQDLTAKSCPAHNYVIWSRILQFLYLNDHHIETMCRALHLGRFLKVKVTAWPFSIIVSGP